MCVPLGGIQRSRSFGRKGTPRTQEKKKTKILDLRKKGSKDVITGISIDDIRSQYGIEVKSLDHNYAIFHGRPPVQNEYTIYDYHKHLLLKVCSIVDYKFEKTMFILNNGSATMFNTRFFEIFGER